MRLYVSSRSYPELREVEAGFLARGVLWLRAFASAARDPAFLGFAALQLGLTLGGLLVAGAITSRIATGPVTPGRMVWIPVYTIGLQLPAMLLAVSVGGDVLRPHLRAVNRVARDACPACGYGLRSQFAAAAAAETSEAAETAEAAAEPVAVVRCPECGADVPLTIRSAPHRIPRGFRAVRWP